MVKELAVKALVTGAGGQLGRTVARVLAAEYDVVPLTRAELDLTDESRVRAGVVDGREVGAVVDRVVSPSYVDDVATATLALLRAAAPRGLYHCVGSGHGTWFEVATALAGELGVEPVIRGITHDELELPAARPRFCALSNRKLAAAGVEMPHWRDAVARYAGIRLRI